MFSGFEVLLLFLKNNGGGFGRWFTTRMKKNVKQSVGKIHGVDWN